METGFCWSKKASKKKLSKCSDATAIHVVLESKTCHAFREGGLAFSHLVITAIIGICAFMYVGVGGCLHVPQKKRVVAFTLVGVNRGELYIYLTLVEEVLTRLVSKFYIMGKSPRS